MKKDSDIAGTKKKPDHKKIADCFAQAAGQIAAGMTPGTVMATANLAALAISTASIMGAVAVGSAMGLVGGVCAVSEADPGFAERRHVLEAATAAWRTRKELQAVARGEGIREAIVVKAPLRFKPGNTASFVAA